MDIKKLCEDFHEAVGKDKTIKIFIEDGDVNGLTDWVSEEYNKAVFERSMDENTATNPYWKITTERGDIHSYEKGSVNKYSTDWFSRQFANESADRMIRSFKGE